ncbi:MAG: hypothetical protein JWN04_4285 [Myxococcaceae bacterium]|nr:hypothetical protein [Myxococcaceae bacterium]
MKLRWKWALVLGVLASCSTDVCAPGGGDVCTFGAYDDGFDGAVPIDAAVADAGAVGDAASPLVLGIDGGSPAP